MGTYLVYEPCNINCVRLCVSACVCVLQDGGFSVLQTGGAAGWCVNRVTGETMQMATRSPAGHLTCTRTRTRTHCPKPLAMRLLSVRKPGCSCGAFRSQLV